MATNQQVIANKNNPAKGIALVFYYTVFLFQCPDIRFPPTDFFPRGCLIWIHYPDQVEESEDSLLK